MTVQLRNIVIGVADTTREDPQLAAAIALAATLDATLHVVHAYDMPDPARYPYLQMTVFTPESLQQIFDRQQHALEGQVRAITDSSHVKCLARPAPAALALLDVADEVNADLIIVGASHHGRLARAIVGSTAQRVIRRSELPVLVAGGAGERVQRILLTTDMSELSTKVMIRGAALADALAGGGGTERRALLVVGYDLPMIMPMEPGGIEKVAARKLDEYLGRIGGAGVRPVVGHVRVGEPAREILAEVDAWGADLLVLGTHGRGPASRFLIGSVAESVLRRVECDVLVLPAAAVEAG